MAGVLFSDTAEIIGFDLGVVATLQSCMGNQSHEALVSR
jgi:hypothetical protein